MSNFSWQSLKYIESKWNITCDNSWLRIKISKLHDIVYKKNCWSTPWIHGLRDSVPVLKMHGCY